jgi:hypothetical protein
VITRGLSLLVGAVGVGAAGAVLQSGQREASSTTSAAPAAAPVAGLSFTSTDLSLYVRDVRYATPDLKPGELPTRSMFTSPHGRLEDSAGTVLGTFAGGVLPGSAGQIAFQRFVFPNGTIVGMGSGKLADEEYAVVGGTGIYAGAIGTYRTRLELGPRGNDAAFTFNVTGVR